MRRAGLRRPGVRPALRALSGPQRGAVVRGAADGALVVLMMRRRGVGPLLPAPRPDVREDVEAAREVAAAVDAGLGLLPVHATCLRRSVTLLRELRRRGLAATLQVGVRSGAGGVQAHAWVQVGDVVINDDPTATRSFTTIAAGDLERAGRSLR